MVFKRSSMHALKHASRPAPQAQPVGITSLSVKISYKAYTFNVQAGSSLPF
jgi:hypothetical protein